MDKEEMADYWYREILKKTPELWRRKVTEDTIQYLTECGISHKIIADILKKTKKDILEPDDLPDILYEDRREERRDIFTGWTYYAGKNYLKKGEYYYHPELMLRNPPPRIIKGKEIPCSYYCEPKIRFEIDNVISYTTKRTGITHHTRNSIIAFQNMLQSLDSLYPEFESIDIVLTAIDMLSQRIEEHRIIMSELTEYIPEAVEHLKIVRADLAAFGMNKIVWRSERWRM